MEQELAELVPAGALEDFKRVALELSSAGKQSLLSGLRLFPRTSSSSASTAAAAAASDSPSPDALVTIPNVSFLNPRGSFNVDFGPGFVEFRGKKLGKIRLESKEVEFVQYLEKEDALSLLLIQKTNASDESGSIVISLKGANAKAAACQVLNDGDIPASLLAQSKNDKSLRHELFASWLSFSFADKLEDSPPKLEQGGFVSAVNPKKRFVSCHSRNINEGKLFPLKSGLLFVGSGPFIAMPTWCSEVLALNRSNSRTFELQVRQTGIKDLLLVFSSIHAEEVPVLQAYFKRTTFLTKSQSRANREDSDEEEEGSGSGEESDSEGEEDEEEDSVYHSQSSAAEEEDEEEGVEEVEEDELDKPKRKADKEGEEGEEEEDSESSSGEDDEDKDDKLKQEYDDVAEMIEEAPYKAEELEDVIPEGRKRQRKLLPAPDDLL
ncbi:hypothetical protein BASA81_005556 [Batrachochytrium salamandrivorans]|nr:hypothetical protein BASA81_005556 [Batrachochytrium salamandrivorans]